MTSYFFRILMIYSPQCRLVSLHQNIVLAHNLFGQIFFIEHIQHIDFYHPADLGNIPTIL